MAKHLQKQFEEFHETIKLNDKNENAKLREKRDLLLKELKAGLKEKFGDTDPNIHKFESFNQGSYWMGTGVQPLDGDYDIDIGLTFHFSKGDYKPVEVKQWVYDALETKKRTVEWKRPCIRVQYTSEGELLYHVDLVCYSGADFNADNKTYLAKGYSGSASENKFWEVAAPFQLKELIDSQYEDADDRKQFRRIIRYLKRWKDHNFKTSGHGAATGIAITALAMEDFWIEKEKKGFENTTDYNDLKALHSFISRVINRFGRKYVEGELVDDISIALPVSPGNDLFEKMSFKQKEDLKNRLESLRDAISPMLGSGRDAHKDALEMQKHFGDDFPVPPKPSNPGYSSSNYSA